MSACLCTFSKWLTFRRPITDRHRGVLTDQTASVVAESSPSSQSVAWTHSQASGDDRRSSIVVMWPGLVGSIGRGRSPQQTRWMQSIQCHTSRHFAVHRLPPLVKSSVIRRSVDVSRFIGVDLVQLERSDARDDRKAKRSIIEPSTSVLSSHCMADKRRRGPGCSLLRSPRKLTR